MATSPQSAQQAGRPTGRDEIREAVLGAARDLLTERGPDGFTVRDVAARAQVNHALVHRHFGTKAGVLEQVLTDQAAAVANAVRSWQRDGSGDPAELLVLLSGHPAYWRTLAQTVLEAPDAAVPGTAATTAPFRRLWESTTEHDPERAAGSALAGATTLGWLIFGAFMCEVTGADADAVRRLAGDQVARLAGGEAP
jgi:AcrR family transcriptional regulator